MSRDSGRAGLLRRLRITPQLFAVPIVIIGGLVTAILHKLFIPLPVVLGIFPTVTVRQRWWGSRILRSLGTP